MVLHWISKALMAAHTLADCTLFSKLCKNPETIFQFFTLIFPSSRSRVRFPFSSTRDDILNCKLSSCRCCACSAGSPLFPATAVTLPGWRDASQKLFDPPKRGHQLNEAPRQERELSQGRTNGHRKADNAKASAKRKWNFS